MNRRRILKEQREDHREWTKMQEQREPVQDSFASRVWAVFCRVLRFLVRTKGVPH